MPQTRLLPPDDEGLADAVAILRAGGRVALPTETVYGLGADARSDAAVAGIFAAKDRPAFNPLIVHLPDLDAAGAFVELPAPARALAGAFWPGPMTLVLPLKPGAGIAPLVTAGLPTLGLRVPAHPLARRLLRAFGGPIAAPSANPSGRVSATEARHVMAGLSGRIEAVIDGGPCGVGLESTIFGFDADGTARLLRPGAITAEAAAAVLGAPVLPPAPEAGITAPGQLLSHYAPSGSVRLNATAAREGEVLLGFGPVKGDLSLSETGDLAEAAARLFGLFHELDRRGAARIAVAPIPDEGLGHAINDRLRRAAAPRG